ncbi:MAG: hypothetical protein OQK98_12360 [Gammaproteobacteria bacterium]|nr:hypothetical protein [Gammaproteobacteria bacterium]
MQQILIYSDSISWDLLPGTRQRLSISKRYGGVMQTTLSSHALDIQHARNYMNGRRSALVESQNDARNSSDESQSSLRMVPVDEPVRLNICL